MEKTRGKYDNRIIIVIVAALLCAFIIIGADIGLTRGHSMIRELKAQVEDQKEQMEQMLYALEQCREMKKAHAVERSIFDDIINGRVSIEEVLRPTPEPLGDKNRIKY